MKKVIVLVVLVMIVLSLGSCGGIKEKNNPKDVIDKYIKSARDGDAKSLFEASYFIVSDYDEEYRDKLYERCKENGSIDKMLERGFKDCGDIDTYEIDSVGTLEDYEVPFDKSADYKSRKYYVTVNTLEDSRNMVFTLVRDQQGYWVVRELRNDKE